MVNSSNNEIWAQCLDILSKEIETTLYNASIRHLKLVELTEDTAYLTVADDISFIVNPILSKYFSNIANALIEVTGNSYNVKVLSVSDYEKLKKDKEEKSPVPPDFFKSHLNPKYTYDSFITGSCNQMAYAAAVAVASSPGASYNPLFIYGNSGLGKTHLMVAIGNYIAENFKDKKVLYVTTETFTNEYIAAIQHRTTDEFRNKYRKIDVLLIDDIQFISRAERTQEEFFNTFNDLHEEGKQIVVTCDRPLTELTVIEDRLRTRLAWGLIADVQAPDYETKVAILNKKASDQDFTVENDILDYIAHYTGENIRELEGVINHLAMNVKQGREMSIAIAEQAVKHISMTKEKPSVTVSIILDAVSKFFDVSIEDITSTKRNAKFTFPRHVAMFLCRSITSMSYPEIGEAFGGRDHTSVMHAFNKITEQLENKPELKNALEEIRNNILR